ncbi:MAG TPA: response regulator transcription factor [Pirellulales bacterium]|jgi:two-component system OmpR family response regulator/two-component system copper resistance phosphate regulon response regulator CusR|nr:response regulator transcription factor [Pirellulales bacterium]
MDLLIVEDDPLIGKSLQKGFQEAGHQCVWVRDGIRGLELGRSQRFDAITLDLMLPGLPGLDVLKTLRNERILTPVILLTARGAIEERVEGLTVGADDYLVKPFSFVELMARIEAVCRRSVSRPSATLEVGDLRLDLATRRATRGTAECELTPTEFSLLEYLMRFAGKVVTRKMLCEHLWETDWDGTTNVIDVHINRLRGKLDRGFGQSLILTVRGRGYALRES